MQYSECKMLFIFKYLSIRMSNDCKCCKTSASRDPLFFGEKNIKIHFDMVTDEKIYNYIHDNGKFYVPQRVRFRDDEEFISVKYITNLKLIKKLEIS